jgi:hypothetical protein
MPRQPEICTSHDRCTDFYIAQPHPDNVPIAEELADPLLDMEAPLEKYLGGQGFMAEGDWVSNPAGRIIVTNGIPVRTFGPPHNPNAKFDLLIGAPGMSQTSYELTHVETIEDLNKQQMILVGDDGTPPCAAKRAFDAYYNQKRNTMSTPPSAPEAPVTEAITPSDGDSPVTDGTENPQSDRACRRAAAR